MTGKLEHNLMILKDSSKEQKLKMLQSFQFLVSLAIT